VVRLPCHRPTTPHKRREERRQCRLRRRSGLKGRQRGRSPHHSPACRSHHLPASPSAYPRSHHSRLRREAAAPVAGVEFVSAMTHCLGLYQPGIPFPRPLFDAYHPSAHHLDAGRRPRSVNRCLAILTVSPSADGPERSFGTFAWHDTSGAMMGLAGLEQIVKPCHKLGDDNSASV
jgi:hypothetical protein